MPEPPPPQPCQPQPAEPADAIMPVPPTPPHFAVRDIFVGADGLRAGWSIILFAVLFLALLGASGLLLYPIQSQHGNAAQSQPQPAIQPNAPMAPRTVFSHEGLPLLSVLIATWLMAKIERRPFTAYGFRAHRSFRNFGAGLTWGIALLSLLVLSLRAAGLLVFDARLLFGADVFRYGVIWITGFLLVGLLEESLSRGYLQYTLARGLSGTYRWLFGEAHANAVGFWAAALILSFAFGVGHRTNPGESPLGLLSAGLAGSLFCFSLWRTGSLWWAIGFHASWDWAQSFLYGVADSGLMVRGHLFATRPVGKPYLSGGLTGPEGSLLLLPVMFIGVLAVLLTLPRTNAGYKPANAPVTSLD